MSGTSDQHSKKTDIEFLGDVAGGTHVCLFYETSKDLIDTLVPYFKAGLESKEFCLWAVSEPLAEDDAINALRQRIPRFDRFLANRSIEIISAHDWYLDGDRFDLKKVIGGWNEKLRNALAKGFKAMRVSGNAFWLNSKHWKDFCAYERDLNESIAGQRMSVLCTYPLAASEPADILEVASAHQFAIARRNGEWEFINTITPQALTHSLTPRELEVLGWVARGKTARDTAQILHISKRTIDEHVQNVVRKLGAVNRTHAIAIALQNHIVKI
jgi:DNA-binding CsgD family transcriptional regulator